MSSKVHVEPDSDLVDPVATVVTTANVGPEAAAVSATEDAPKRKRGRPRKVALAEVKPIKPAAVPVAPADADADDEDDTHEDIFDAAPPAPVAVAKPLKSYTVTLKDHTPAFLRTVQASGRREAVKVYNGVMGIIATEHKYVVNAAD